MYSPTSKLASIFTANRVAAICTWLSGLAAFILGVAQTLPGTWPNYALAGAGLLTKAVTTIHFMTGSQKYDALVANNPSAALDPNAPFPDAEPSTEAEITQALAERPETAVTPDPEPLHDEPTTTSGADKVSTSTLPSTKSLLPPTSAE